MQISDIPEVVTISPFGSARICGLIHEGRNHIILRASLDGRDVVIKTPRPGCQPENLGMSSLWVGSETFHHTHFGGRSSITNQAMEPIPNEVRFALLMSECDALNKFASAWNSHAIGVGTFNGFAQAMRYHAPGRGQVLHWPCLLLPYYEGRSLESFPPGERLSLFLRALPALWQALTGRLHGDISPTNLLIDPSGELFRILDPAPVAASLLEPTDKDVCFATTPIYYPLIHPFAGHSKISRMLGLLAAPAPATSDGRGFDMDDPMLSIVSILAGAFADERALFRGHPDGDVAARPYPADQQALGLILYFLATGHTLFIPEIVEAPAWATVLFSRGGVYAPQPYVAVRDAIVDGYLVQQLAKISDPRLSNLIRRLVMCEALSTDELATLL